MDVFGLAVTAGGEFLRAAAVGAAHELGVFEALARAGTVDEVAAALGVGARRLRPLLDVLVADGVLARDGDRFRVAGEVPARAEVVRAGWGLLADVVRDDRPLPPHAEGDGLDRYHAHLVSAGAAAAAELVSIVGGGALLDLGGGAGTYTAAFLAADPAARATIVDEAAVLALAREHLAGVGVLDRVTLVEGDARSVEVGDHFDVALLANVLHLHGAEACAALVGAAARAVRPGGVVVIKDLRLDDDRRGSREGLWFALDMAIYTEAGDVHATGALLAWLRGAGLVDVEARELACAPDGIVALGRKPRAGTLRAAPADRDGRRARAEADGFLYLPGLLPAARLASLRALVDDALARRGWLVDGASDPALGLGRWDDPRWVELLAEILPSSAFRELARAPELLDALGAVLDGDPEPDVGDVCRVVSPGAVELATPPHQDAAYLNDPDGVWTAWIALGPCPRALGPLALLPGSHRGGVRPHAPVVAGGHAVGTDVPADAPWVSGDLGAGDVILFSSRTIHRALPNTTRATLRVSVDYRYRAPRP